jgi:glycosyltransferase involved in cell wall biosynthesis
MQGIWPGFGVGPLFDDEASLRGPTPCVELSRDSNEALVKQPLLLIERLKDKKHFIIFMSFMVKKRVIMRPLRIFDINMHHHWGGQPNRILTYNKELKKRGHHVVVSGPKGCVLCKRAKEAGIEIFDDLELARGFRPWSQIPEFLRLRRYFQEQRFDIVHTHGSQDTWLAGLAAKFNSPTIPVIRTRHNTFPIAAHALNRWLYSKVIKRVITISPQVNEYLTRENLFPAEHIVPIYSAPDSERFHPGLDGAPVREELGIPSYSPVIGMVGRYAPEKGHKHLIDAAAIVVKEIPQVRFVLVGKGRSEPAIRAQIKELGLEKNIILTGFRTDVPNVVACFNIFTLTPTSGESLGTSILEGFLEEKPVVATDVGGVCESVRDGETGFLVPPADPEQLADRYLRLIHNPDMREKMGKAGRKLALEEFSIKTLTDKTEKVYYDLLGMKPSN